MSKFTPGPWVAEKPEESNGWWLIREKNITVGLVEREIATVYQSTDATEENSKFIAAAPEMYEALKEMYTYMFEQSGHFRGSNFEPMKLRVEHALAKADGR